MTDLAWPGVRLGLRGLLIASRWGLANRLALSPVHKQLASLSAPRRPQPLETITVLGQGLLHPWAKGALYCLGKSTGSFPEGGREYQQKVPSFLPKDLTRAWQLRFLPRVK